MNQDQKKQLYTVGGLMLVIGFLVGVIVTVAWYSGDGETPSDSSATSTEESTTAGTSTANNDDTDTLVPDADVENGGQNSNMSATDSTDTENDNGQTSDSTIADRSPGVTGGSENAGTPGQLFVDVTGQSAGESVTIDQAAVSVPTWIAVHETRNDGLGNVLGAKWVPEGEHTDVAVSLLRSTEPGQQYFVTLYEDNGDKQFSHTQDTLVQFGGTTLYATFETSEQ